jgi:DNA-binding XRE family transcriptional regulator
MDFYKVDFAASEGDLRMGAKPTISTAQAALLSDQMREFIAMPDADKIKVLPKLLAGLADVLTIPVYQQIFAFGMMLGVADALTAERLSTMRKAVGVSQTELADRLGIKQANIARWETGALPIPKRRVPEILAALNYSADQLAA